MTFAEPFEDQMEQNSEVNCVGFPASQIVPAAMVDLKTTNRPLEAILATDECRAARDLFMDHDYWNDAVVSHRGLSIFYSLLRNLRPSNVVEIGSYRGKTAFVLAHAVHANGHGILHTVGPFDKERFLPLYKHWPKALQDVTRFYPENSAAFFMEADRKQVEFDFVFIDGNHDYEFCLFDIQCAARRMSRGGFIAIDNVSQAGPLCATLDFLKSNPEWTDCGLSSTPSYPATAFGPGRSNIPDTDFIIIRAPEFYSIGSLPFTFGDRPWEHNSVHGFTVQLCEEADGILHTQCILRSFAPHGPAEISSEVERSIVRTDREVVILCPLEIAAGDHYSVEVWFSWRGPGKLRFGRLPQLFKSEKSIQVDNVTKPSTPSTSNTFSPARLPQSRTNSIPMNSLEHYSDIFSGIRPWSGHVPHRFIVDFVGTQTNIEFHPFLFNDPSFDGNAVGNSFEQTRVPQLSDGGSPANAEGWFEAVDWVMAAREARDRYVMITLGANYGAQAVGACKTLQLINPMPYKLVAVEPVPDNLMWIRQHMHNNGIDPDQQWIVPLAISNTTEPLYFPVGAPGIGSNNCFSTNEQAARKNYADAFIESGRTEEALRNLLMHNTTGITKELIPGQNATGEIKLVSSITLNELLGPFDLVDYLEADIQQSEILVFPAFAKLLKRKVRRIHIGTHGKDVHRELHNLFANDGWEMVFSFEPNATHESALGSFETNDGVLTVRNPNL
jgi:predicted O-methyltransferase YrrM